VSCMTGLTTQNITYYYTRHNKQKIEENWDFYAKPVIEKIEFCFFSITLQIGK